MDVNDKQQKIEKLGDKLIPMAVMYMETVGGEIMGQRVMKP